MKQNELLFSVLIKEKHKETFHFPAAGHVGQFVPWRSNLLLPPNESAEGENVSLERNNVRRAVNEVASFP